MPLRSSSLPLPSLVVVNHWRHRAKHEHLTETVHPDAHYLSLLVHGQGRWWNGPSMATFDRPMLSLLPSGDRDRVDALGPTELHWVGFTWPGVRIAAADGGALALSGAGWQMHAKRFVRLDAAGLAKMVERYAELLTASRRPGPAAELKAHALLLELLSYHLDAAEPAGEAPASRAAERCRDLLHRHASEAIAIGSIAEQLAISPDHLRRMFQRRFGIAPHAYHDRLRLGTARELLMTTELRVGEVAARVGYADALYFSRAFKRMFGVAPNRVTMRLALEGKSPTSV